MNDDRRLAYEAAHWTNVARIVHRIPQRDPAGRVPDVPDELAVQIADAAQLLEDCASAVAIFYRQRLADLRRSAAGGRLLNDDGTVRDV